MAEKDSSVNMVIQFIALTDLKNLTIQGQSGSLFTPFPTEYFARILWPQSIYFRARFQPW
jgi:hypothetical protein